MSKIHLPETKRVRSVVMPEFGDVLATGVSESNVVERTHIWQDDVVLLGAELECEAMINDAAMNADGMVNIRMMLSPQAGFNDPGYILTAAVLKVWTGLIAIGGGPSRDIQRMFYPAGYGVNYDEGESINLVGIFEWIGIATLTIYGSARLYYVKCG